MTASPILAVLDSLNLIQVGPLVGRLFALAAALW